MTLPLGKEIRIRSYEKSKNEEPILLSDISRGPDENDSEIIEEDMSPSITVGITKSPVISYRNSNSKQL